MKRRRDREDNATAREEPNLKRARNVIQHLTGTGPGKTSGNHAGKRRPKKFVSRKERRKEERLEKKRRRFGHQQGADKQPQVDQPTRTMKSGGAFGKKNKGRNHQSDKTSSGKTKSPSGTQRKFAKSSLDFANRFDDREISRLEKLMKLKNKKKKKNTLPKSFAADGLDYLLDLCDGKQRAIFNDKPADKGNDDGLSDDSSDDSPMQQENVAADSGESALSDCSGENKEDTDKGEEFADDGSEEEEEEEDEIDMQSDGYLSSSEEDTLQLSKKAAQPSPAVKTVGATTACRGKYVVPAQRQPVAAISSNSTISIQLIRQVRGLVNRLSEANMRPVSQQLHDMYTTNSRNDMNQTLSSAIMAACVSFHTISDRLLAEYMLLIAVLHRRVGTEVGAHFLEVLVKKFDSLHTEAESTDDSKEIDNVLGLISHLYLFKVAHCCLIYDIIRRLLDRFLDKDVTLLLLLLKNVGADIRKDDPMALKDLIPQVKSKAASGKFVEKTRVEFMLDMIMAVCHNNLRKVSGYDPDVLDHRKRVLRGLLPGSVAMAEAQLRIGLDDLLQADAKGRWWVVGSAWVGRTAEEKTEVADNDSAKLDRQMMLLARQQRLNTDVRRNIFAVLMTSEDYIDAFEKLLHLNLKDKQERELVHVVLHCCLQEKTFNPFYGYLCQKLCEFHRSHQVTMQFALWDKLKVADELRKQQLHNLAQLVSHLLASKALSLSVFKVVDFVDLNQAKLTFFQWLLYHLLKGNSERDFRAVFMRICTFDELQHLREGFCLFLKFMHRQVKDEQCSLVQDAAEGKLVLQRLKSARCLLQSKQS